MKTYEEMIQFTVGQMTEGDRPLRYNGWVAYILLAETYGKSQKEIDLDLNAELSRREKERKERRRAENRAAHEARRQANLAKKGVTQ